MPTEEPPTKEAVIEKFEALPAVVPTPEATKAPVQPGPAYPLPAPDAKRLKVTIATPMKWFPGPDVMATLTPAELAKFLPHEVGHALVELALRGSQHPDWKRPDDDKDGQTSDAAFRAQADKYEFEFVAAVGGLCRARNVAVHDARKSGSHFLIWIDADLVPEAPMTMAEAILRMLSHRQPIVGGMYCKRERAKRPSWACTFMPVCGLDADSLAGTPEGGLLQVAELAGGFKCIHWQVFSEIARIYGGDPKKKENGIKYRDRDTGETLFGFYQNLVYDGDLLSEDYWLDFLCRCSQVPILADTKIKLRQRDFDVDGKPIYYPPAGSPFPPIYAEDPEAMANIETIDIKVAAKKP